LPASCPSAPACRSNAWTAGRCHDPVTYVAPAGRHLLVGLDRRLALADTAPVHRARPSADLLLTSAASAYGPHLIAAVLSGGRSECVDGADGVIRIHEAGGIVVAQDPASRLRSGMPAAIETRDADYVLPPGRIGPLLVLLTAPDCPASSDGSGRPLLAG
jgi:two-component system, chemotaxis family, protein-glutamate methylesterase/glutaminase